MVVSFQMRSAWVYGVLAVTPVIAATVLGQLATLPNLESWYRSLEKPALSPPNWVFGPVWTTLYALMAYAAWRVLRLPGNTPGRTTGLILYFGQLAVNALWPWLFFGLHSPLAGLLNIVPQWLLILATTERFRQIDRIAGYCLVPLATWVAFAAILNFKVWELNP
jgi:translocator protein